MLRAPYLHSQADLEGQEQQAHLKNQTDVLSCFDHLGEQPIGMKLRGLNTLATFSAISTKGNNFCDFLFALKQLASQVVDASEFESHIGRVQLMIL